MVLRVPLLINAVDSSGEASWEQVETVVVSLHGGMVRTHQTYPVGVTLDVRRRDDERSARARVVWMSSKINSQGLDLGFEIRNFGASISLLIADPKRQVPKHCAGN